MSLNDLVLKACWSFRLKKWFCDAGIKIEKPMKNYRNPKREIWSEVLRRPTRTYEEIEGLVTSMFEEIRKDGDQGVRKYVKAFDGADLDALEVSAGSRQH